LVLVGRKGQASWTITDRCDGTTVRVTRGTARVTATQGRHRTTTIKAGHPFRVAARPFR
jgi:hypothetical protein